MGAVDRFDGAVWAAAGDSLSSLVVTRGNLTPSRVRSAGIICRVLNQLLRFMAAMNCDEQKQNQFSGFVGSEEWKPGRGRTPGPPGLHVTRTSPPKSPVSNCILTLKANERANRWPIDKMLYWIHRIGHTR
jgi:hypothetical protein